MLEVFAATKLLVSRNAANLRLLRVALVLLVITSGISVAIDIAVFADSGAIVVDVFTLVFAAIWTMYFLKAERVRLVFVERKWLYPVHDVPTPPTPSEKRYVRRRAAITAVAAFVIGLVVVGSQMGDSKPDGGIFGLPILFALFGGAVAWCGPISKKKRDALMRWETESQGRP